MMLEKKRFVNYCLGLAILLGSKVNAQYLCPILPTPSSYVQSDGQLMINGRISINEDGIPEPIREFLLKKCVNELKLITVFTPVSEQLVFKKLYNVPQDYYSIQIDNGITINYSSEVSCFYALTSLFQLMERREGTLLFQKCFVGDAPKYAWRGLHLDVCHNFFSVDEVKRYIDLMSQYKLNRFHWQLTDGEVWRLEIQKYAGFTSRPVSGDDVKSNGRFYTREEVKEIVAYAAERYITVVPEIDLLSHTKVAVTSYPDFLCAGTLVFVKGVLDEVVELFPSAYVHIGGTENTNNDWMKSKKCQDIIREKGLKSTDELQRWFAGELDAYLSSKGKKPISSDGIPIDIFSKNTIVMSRNGFESGIEAAKQAHYTIMSPKNYCSFDYYQNRDQNEPLANREYTPIEKVYAFDPVPKGASPDYSAYVLGGQANLCTAFIPDMKTLEYMTFPRAIALAEALWCEKKPAFEQFRSALVTYHLKRLEEQNVNYSKAIFYPEIQWIEKENRVGMVINSPIENNPLDVAIVSSEGSKEMKNVLQTDTLFIDRTKGKKEISYTVMTKSKLAEKTFAYEFTAHPALALPVKLLTPSLEHSYGTVKNVLTNGVRGVKSRKEDQWLGFDSKLIEMQIDFEHKTHLSGFQIGFLNDSVSGISFPKNVTVVYSTNRKKWKQAGVFWTNALNDGRFVAHFDADARSVKFLVEANEVLEGLSDAGKSTLTYIDELILYFEP
jgi:hexosaminidase